MKILDGGNLKFVCEVIEMKKWYETDSLYFIFAICDSKVVSRHIKDDDLNDIKIDVDNEHYVEPSRKFVVWKK